MTRLPLSLMDLAQLLHLRIPDCVSSSTTVVRRYFYRVEKVSETAYADWIDDHFLCVYVAVVNVSATALSKSMRELA